jgi:tripartite-type tricarboxylate transporter receptor subunit TctC
MKPTLHKTRPSGQHPRRQFLRLAVGAAALPAMSCDPGVQSYPSRPVRLVVGYAPGGTTDIAARLTGQWLSDRLGRRFIIENQPGANGIIATEAVVRAPADGYTLLMLNTSNAINATLYEKLNFVFVRDIAPVASVLSVPNLMVVHPLFPARSVPEFISYAKANPGKVNYGSSGIGSGLHVAAEMFKMMAGIDLVPVQYRGTGPMLTDLLGGQSKSRLWICRHRSNTSGPEGCAHWRSPHRSVPSFYQSCRLWLNSCQDTTQTPGLVSVHPTTSGSGSAASS